MPLPPVPLVEVPPVAFVMAALSEMVNVSPLRMPLPPVPLAEVPPCAVPMLPLWMVSAPSLAMPVPPSPELVSVALPPLALVMIPPKMFTKLL